jgi:uncharacterized protein with HEPN domain
MARTPLDHLTDVLEAIAKIRQYTRGGEAAFRRSSMARDAVIARLIQIGQAVKDVQEAGVNLESLAPGVPWRDVAGMRDRLAHKYWDADSAIIWSVVATDLGKLQRSVQALTAGRSLRKASAGAPAKAKSRVRKRR